MLKPSHISCLLELAWEKRRTLVRMSTRPLTSEWCCTESSQHSPGGGRLLMRRKCLSDSRACDTERPTD
jgi:hypothetical protein